MTKSICNERIPSTKHEDDDDKGHSAGDGAREDNIEYIKGETSRNFIRGATLAGVGRPRDGHKRDGNTTENEGMLRVTKRRKLNCMCTRSCSRATTENSKRHSVDSSARPDDSSDSSNYFSSRGQFLPRPTDSHIATTRDFNNRMDGGIDLDVEATKKANQSPHLMKFERGGFENLNDKAAHHTIQNMGDRKPSFQNHDSRINDGKLSAEILNTDDSSVDSVKIRPCCPTPGSKLSHKHQSSVSHSQCASKRSLKELAPSLVDYLCPGGARKYSPRPEWCLFSSAAALASTSATAAVHHSNTSDIIPKSTSIATGLSVNSKPAHLAAKLNASADLIATRGTKGEHGQVSGGNNIERGDINVAAAVRSIVGPDNESLRRMASALVAGIETAASAQGQRAEALALALTAAGVPIAESEAISAEAIAAAEAEIKLQRDCNVNIMEEINHSSEHGQNHERRNNCYNHGCAYSNAMEDDDNQNNHQLHQCLDRQPTRNIVSDISPTVNSVFSASSALAVRLPVRQAEMISNSGAVGPHVIQVVEEAVAWWVRKRQQRQLEQGTGTDGFNAGDAGSSYAVHERMETVDRSVAGSVLPNLVREGRGASVPMRPRPSRNNAVVGMPPEAHESDVESVGAVVNSSAGNAIAPTTKSEGDHSPATPPFSNKVAVFGVECDTALHLAIKDGATEAALGLIKNGACVHFSNAKGITPLILASQKGNMEVVRALLREGAMVNASTLTGSTALIQACHFGRLRVVEELLLYGAMVEQANYKNTTALMRASQEGHEHVVRLLLRYNAYVNRRNDEKMSALMLCSQRGHAGIVRMLIKAGAEIDVKTAQDSTSLMLACKRGHLAVAKILVASGTELMLKDCKGRTVLETAIKKGRKDFADILTSSAQLRLMKEESRRERNFCMVQIWNLLQLERATVRICAMNITIHKIAENLSNPLLRQLSASKRTLVQAMTLPAPLIELVTSFIPHPRLWENRLMLLTSRCQVHPDSAIYSALDLIDEVLEDGGFLDACDIVGVDPPSGFQNWAAFQVWCRRCDIILSKSENKGGIDKIGESVLRAQDESNTTLRVESALSQRRNANYLKLLANGPPMLATTLASHPYDMPEALFTRLRAEHDIQSLVRRLSTAEIHFSSSVASKMVTLANMVVLWCGSRPTY